jgi:NAD(P)-dependent dehydrogenase (short-subunit alcohol dehydrogenase family)
LSPSIYAPGLFQGKVALVTGGGSGIGLAIAHELGALGCWVVISGRNEAKLRVAADELTTAGMTVIWRVCDIREPEQVENLITHILETWGHIDYLVNNAGGQFPAPVEGTSFKGWRAVIDNNLNGTFLVSKVVGERAMLPAANGRIVNIVANMWRGFPGMAHTGAARAGVVNLTQSLAIEWAARGVLVNAIAPGTIRSSGTDRYDPAFITKAVAATPLKRAGTVADVARAVAYLFSPAGDYITGETLCIDGGARLWGDVWTIPDPIA